MSMLDLLGLGLIGPYVALAFDPEENLNLISSKFDVIGVYFNKNNVVLYFGILLALVFLVKSFFSIFINYTIICFSQNQQVRLRALLMEYYQTIDYEVYLQRNSSEYIHSMRDLVSQYSNQGVMPLLKLFSDGIVGLVILTMLSVTHGYMLLIFISIIAIFVLFYYMFSSFKTRNYGDLSNIAYISMVKCISEAINGISEIRILGKTKYFFARVIDPAKEFTRMTSRVMIYANASRYLLELMLILFIVILFTVVTGMGDEMIHSLPELGIFAVASLRLVPIANAISSNLINLKFARNGVDRLYDDLRRVNVSNRIPLLTDAPCEINTFNRLEFRNVKYGYEISGKPVLHDLNLKISKGDCIGLMGPSGSGKTTLVNLLLGLLKPLKGEILINEKDLNSCLTSWHNRVAYLPQSIFLMDDTIRRNIALGVDDDDIDSVLLEKAIEKASLDEFIEDLPDGLATTVGEGGKRLSGGQCQRIALARAFYHNRDFLVLDEATSSLDYDIEAEIVEHINLLKGEVTLVIIAHRLTTLRHCDRIYKLDKGGLVKAGHLNAD